LINWIHDGDTLRALHPDLNARIYIVLGLSDKGREQYKSGWEAASSTYVRNLELLEQA
jgi:hypothetical protein